jgi:hypothetical protein
VETLLRQAFGVRPSLMILSAANRDARCMVGRPDSRRAGPASERSRLATDSARSGTERRTGDMRRRCAEAAWCGDASRSLDDLRGRPSSLETTDGTTTAVRDDHDFTIFLTDRATTSDEPRCILYFEVADVDIAHERLINNDVELIHAPRENPWGYGPELCDPDGHAIRLWGARSVR